MDFKQGTTDRVLIGPILTTAGAAATALTIAKEAVLISKNNATMIAVVGTTTNLVQTNKGYYTVLLGTGDLDTVGKLLIDVRNSSAMPAWKEGNVLAPNFYDMKYSTAVVAMSNIRVDMIDAPNATAIQAITTAIKAAVDGIKAETTLIHAETTAIKAKTDKMTYTSGNDLDVNVQKINDITLAGDGSTIPMGAA